MSSQLNHTLTRTKTFVGTPLWMSPEVLEQEPYDEKVNEYLYFGCKLCMTHVDSNTHI